LTIFAALANGFHLLKPRDFANDYAQHFGLAAYTNEKIRRLTSMWLPK